MDSNLKEIMETDRAAREKYNAEKRRFESVNDEIASEKEATDRALREKAQSEIESTAAEMNEKKKSETERIDRYFSETSEKLEKAYRENRERWAEEIFREVTK